MECTCRQGQEPRLLPWYRQRDHPRNYACAAVFMIIQAFIFLIPMANAKSSSIHILLGCFALMLAFGALLIGVACYKSSHGYREYYEGYHLPKSRRCDYCQQRDATAVYSL